MEAQGFAATCSVQQLFPSHLLPYQLLQCAHENTTELYSCSFNCSTQVKYLHRHFSKPAITQLPFESWGMGRKLNSKQLSL